MHKRLVLVRFLGIPFFFSGIRSVSVSFHWQGRKRITEGLSFQPYTGWWQKESKVSIEGGCSAPSQSQVTGMMRSSPLAPALAQSLVSSLIKAVRLVTETCAPSNMAPLRCFQSDHAVRIMSEQRPLRWPAGEETIALLTIQVQVSSRHSFAV